MKRDKQLLIKLNESENNIVHNMRDDGINISQYVRNILTKYSENNFNGKSETTSTSSTLSTLLI